MATIVTAVGVLLIFSALLDVFQTLFHPAGRGAMSDWTARLSWRAFRLLAKKRPHCLTYAGPTAILLIIVSWVALVWLGFALVYFPRVAVGFDFSHASSASSHKGIVEAMSLSLESLITISEGAYAKLHWLQFVQGMEAVIGFGLLTASVSWLLSIYPVLEARRSVAQGATLLHHAERENQMDLVRDVPDKAQEWIFQIGEELATLRNQMSQFPITYYFDTNEPETALAGALSYLYELAGRASREPVAGLKIAGTVLGGAVESFLEMLAEDFLSLPTEDKKAILRAYASEQMTDLILLRCTIPYPRKNAS